MTTEVLIEYNNLNYAYHYWTSDTSGVLLGVYIHRRGHRLNKVEVYSAVAGFKIKKLKREVTNNIYEYDN